MRRSRSLALVVALVSCRPESIEPAPTSPPVEPPRPREFTWHREFELAPAAGSFAVVPRGAGLWLSPDAEGPAAVFTKRKGFGEGGVVQVLGRVGEFVEVQLDWQSRSTEAHCHPPVLGLGLRVFVREVELADVVLKPQVIDFGDGTGFNIAPGVVVSAKEDDVLLQACNMQSSDIEVSVHASADASLQVGKIYTPARMLAGPREQVSDGGTIEAGGEAYVDWFGMTLFGRSERDPDHVLIGGECLQIAGSYIPRRSLRWPRIDRYGSVYHGLIDPFDLSMEGLIEKGVLHREIPKLWMIPAGAELSWPDGTPAGTTVREFVIRQAPTHAGSQSCFIPYFDFEWSWAPGLRFCVAAELVETVGLSRARTSPTIVRDEFRPRHLRP
jgi:hypothetical protein